MKGERLASILSRIDKIKAECDLPVDQLARRFLLSQKTIGKVIFGVKRKQHVIDLQRDLEKPQLDADTLIRLKALYEADFGLVGQKHLSY
jgi:aryl-alcohol dehydrogenase-like predicted oxidoreductase